MYLAQPLVEIMLQDSHTIMEIKKYISCRILIKS